MRQHPHPSRDPDNVQWSVSWAYAARRADSINAARLILLEAVERQPEAAILHYNLACYECQLGDLEVAKARLRHAINLDDGFRAMALEDEDLEPLWESFSG
jgi:tetratricopeptide (TPR) repeat protein